MPDESRWFIFADEDGWWVGDSENEYEDYGAFDTLREAEACLVEMAEPK